MIANADIIASNSGDGGEAYYCSKQKKHPISSLKMQTAPRIAEQFYELTDTDNNMAVAKTVSAPKNISVQPPKQSISRKENQLRRKLKLQQVRKRRAANAASRRDQEKQESTSVVVPPQEKALSVASSGVNFSVYKRQQLREAAKMYPQMTRVQDKVAPINSFGATLIKYDNYDPSESERRKQPSKIRFQRAVAYRGQANISIPLYVDKHISGNGDGDLQDDLGGKGMNTQEQQMLHSPDAKRVIQTRVQHPMNPYFKWPKTSHKEAFQYKMTNKDTKAHQADVNKKNFIRKNELKSYKNELIVEDLMNKDWKVYDKEQAIKREIQEALLIKLEQEAIAEQSTQKTI